MPARGIGELLCRRPGPTRPSLEGVNCGACPVAGDGVRMQRLQRSVTAPELVTAPLPMDTIEARYMDDVTRAQELIGNDVYDRDGDRIGRVGTVYLDDATHQPEWVTVRTGLFGMKESFVPLAGSSTREQRINLGVSRDQIREAPRIDTEHGHLSEEEGRDLYGHYGIRPPSATAPQPVTDQPQLQRPDLDESTGEQESEAAAPATTGRHHRSESDPEERHVIPTSGQGREGRHRKDSDD